MVGVQHHFHDTKLKIWGCCLHEKNLMEGAYYRCSVSSLSALFLAFPSTRGAEPSLVLWRSLRYSYTEPAGGSHTHTTSNLIGAFQISKNADPATRNWIHRHQALPLALFHFSYSLHSPMVPSLAVAVTTNHGRTIIWVGALRTVPNLPSRTHRHSPGQLYRRVQTRRPLRTGCGLLP